MKIRWSEPATSELEAIFVYILERSPKSAEVVARRILDRVGSLGEFPLKGKTTRRMGTRKLTIADYPYVIVYRINSAANEVEILNVRHTARKQPPAED